MADTERPWWQAEETAKDTLLDERLREAIAQGGVVPSHQTPYASGAAEPVYPVEGAIGGGALGGVSKVALRALFEMAAKNARRTEMEETFGPVGAGGGGNYGWLTEQDAARGAFSQTVRGPKSRLWDPRENIYWQGPIKRQGDPKALFTTPSSPTPVRSGYMGQGRTLADEPRLGEMLRQGRARRNPDGTIEHISSRALERLLRQGRARRNPDGTIEFIELPEPPAPPYNSRFLIWKREHTPLKK